MNKIITCVDGSAITHAVTDAAIWASKKLNKPISLVHTLEKHHEQKAGDYTGAIGFGAQSLLLDEMTQLDEQRAKISLKLADELLNSLSEQVKNAGINHVELVKRHGDIYDAIIDYKADTRLIVIGRCGMDHSQNMSTLGSHIETLIRNSTAPILILPDEFNTPKSFMVAYDGRDTADKALKQVIDGGLLQGLHCHLVSIKNNQPELKEKFKNAQHMLKTKGFDVTATFLEGDISNSLLQYREENNVDLIVMGAFAHSKLRQFFVGSNTIKMLESAAVPVVVLK